jgi:hypothetical protein
LPLLLDALLAALAHPEEHLTVEPSTVSLDAMNFVVADSPSAVKPCAAVMRLAERGPFAVLVGRFPRSALRPPEASLTDAAKYL